MQISVSVYMFTGITLGGYFILRKLIVQIWFGLNFDRVPSCIGSLNTICCFFYEVYHLSMPIWSLSGGDSRVDFAFKVGPILTFHECTSQVTPVAAVLAWPVYLKYHVAILSWFSAISSLERSAQICCNLFVTVSCPLHQIAFFRFLSVISCSNVMMYRVFTSICSYFEIYLSPAQLFLELSVAAILTFSLAFFRQQWPSMRAERVLRDPSLYDGCFCILTLRLTFAFVQMLLGES